MIRYLVLIPFVTLLGVAHAEVVEISFPELTGDYESGWVPPETAPSLRSTVFSFPPDIQSMDGLRLVLSGAWVEGVIICSQAWGPPDTTSFTPGLSMYLTSPGNIDGFFHASVQPPHGDFSQLSAEFEFCCPGGPGDLSLLLGTVVFVEFFCDLVLPGICGVDVDSYGTVEEVRLEALGAVPAQGSTWGGVKALYR